MNHEDNLHDFSTLPVEMQREYMLYLPVTDIANYCAVNPSVHKICTDDYFWLLKVDHDFHVYEYKPEGITYQEQFLDLLASNSINGAAIQGRLDVMIYLTSQGAVPDKKTSNFATRWNRVNVREWLKQKGLNPDRDDAKTAIVYGSIDILNWLESNDVLPTIKTLNNAMMSANATLPTKFIRGLEWAESRGIIGDSHTAKLALQYGLHDIVKWFAARGIFP